MSGTVIEASTIFARQNGDLRATGGYPVRAGKYALAGFDPAVVLGGSL